MPMVGDDAKARHPLQQSFFGRGNCKQYNALRGLTRRGATADEATAERFERLDLNMVRKRLMISRLMIKSCKHFNKLYTTKAAKSTQY